jgi:hypothetical protein
LVAIGAVDNQNGVVGGGPSETPTAAAPEINIEINWDHVCFALFGLETAGGSRKENSIIEEGASSCGDVLGV